MKRNNNEMGFGDDGLQTHHSYMNYKKSKLGQQFSERVKKEESNQVSNIFQGISIFVNGYTIPSAEDLKKIMLSNGGTFQYFYHAGKTNFVIATNLADAKIKKLQGDTKIVKPNWISDCLSAGKLLNYTPYLLYSNHPKSQCKINFSTINKKAEVQTNLNEEPSNSASKRPVFENDETFNTDLPQHKETSEKPSLLPRLPLKQSEATSKTSTERAGREPNFLSEFYNHSRLHHISTMGAMFKKYIADLRKTHNGHFPGLNELLEWKKQQNYENVVSAADEDQLIYMHIDMDCFFVSVGLRNRPELRGLPVAVTHAKGNQSLNQGSNRAAEIECYRQRTETKTNSSVVLKDWMKDSDNSSMAEIASCSYEARKAGLKNGMFLGTALKKCPNLKTIPYDFEGYKQVSFVLYNTIASFSLNIEAVSCDELFVDCTQILKTTKSTPMQLAAFLRNKIKSMTGCPASTGFGGNILLSRLATKKAKPDGQYHLIPEDVEQFMQDIKIEDLPGVGRNLAQRLHQQNVSTCRDLQSFSLSQLKTIFGNKTGESLYLHCRGQDGRSLDLDYRRKSVSAEVNYGIRFVKPEEVVIFVKDLAEEVRNRLEEINSRGRRITLKLMVKAKNAPAESAKFMGHGVCDSLSRSATLATETNDTAVIAKEVMSLLGQLCVQPCDLRGMGIQVSKLTESKAERNLNNFIVRGSAVGTRMCKPAAGPSTEGQHRLDPDFLDALPEDIRAEVTKEHTRIHQAGDVSPHTSLSTLTFSQIDPNFLDALPDFVKQDLIQDLQHLQNPIPQVLSKKHSVHQSPSKSKNGSPKKGGRKCKTKILPKGQQKIDIILASPEKKNVSVLIESPAESAEAAEEDSSFGILKLDAPLKEFLCPFRDWVEEGDPDPLDQQFLIDFLLHVIWSKKYMDKVEAALTTLYRAIEKKPSNLEWKVSYQEIVNQVQKAMLRVYKFRLKVNSFKV